MYWSRSEIKTNNVRYEFNRPYLQHKELQTDDALAVEATSYALLTLFKVEGGGVTIVQVKQCETKNCKVWTTCFIDLNICLYFFIFISPSKHFQWS